MIEITKSNNRITVDGHAKRPAWVPPGANIICAAVSALTLTLIEGLREVAGMEIRAEEDVGHASVSWEQANEKGQALIDTWLLGIQAIRDSYGEINITIV